MTIRVTVEWLDAEARSASCSLCGVTVANAHRPTHERDHWLKAHQG
jgi:hypothetical protein